MSEPNDDLLNEGLDKVEEYFKLKDVIRNLRNDLKDLKLQKPEIKQIDELAKKLKKLRDDIKEDENIKSLNEKIETSKERTELLKELIRVELLDKSQEEVKRNGRKLKLVNILKEMKDEVIKTSKNKFKQRNIFRS